MEAKNLLDNGSTALSFPLNYDCMFALFQRLRMEECMNLAEAYEGLQSVADWTFKTKFNNVTINFDKSIDINRFLYHVGPFVKTLELMLFHKFRYTEEDLVKIQEQCTELKNLTLRGFERSDVKYNPFCSAHKLESLTLGYCSLAEDDDFFNRFTNLKSLNIVGCKKISNIAMRKCFENNQGITSFASMTQNLMYSELLHLLPNLERLGLHYDSTSMDLSFLSKLPSLRALTLRCTNGDVNLNAILSDLAMNTDLEELELNNVSIDEKTFKIIKSFGKLKQLVVTTHKYTFTSSNELPCNLKTLKLGGFNISQRQLVMLITQQEHLQNINLADCRLMTRMGFNSIADSIVRTCNLDENRKVNLILTTSKDRSPKVSYARLLNLLNLFLI